MAETKLIAKLETYCTCSICKTRFDDPKVLSCRHTFCTECLQQYLHSSTVKKKDRGFTCPLCREFIKVPKPKLAVSRWAEQFTKDFFVASLQSDLQEFESEVQDEVEATPSPLITKSNSPLNAISRFPAKSAENPNTQSLAEAKIDDKSTVTIARSVAKLSGHLVSTLAIGDENSTNLYACDLVALKKDGLPIIATFDFTSKVLIILEIDGEMKISSRRDLDLGAQPWRICKVKENEVAVTVNQPNHANAILICCINDDTVDIVRRIPTPKTYEGIAIITEGFVATTGENVDILDEDGKVFRENTIKVPNTKYTDNSYVTVTSEDTIVVTDSEGKAVSMVTQEGKIQWQRRSLNYPSGITSTTDGVIFVSDAGEGVVYQFSFRGRKMCKVTDLSRPSGITADETGHLYVICDYKTINVYKLVPSIA